MMKVLFSTNLPSPYRVDFFNELGKYCDLTVCYERETASDRDGKWTGKAAESFKAVRLDLKPYKEDRSKGSALRDYVKNNDFDIVIFTNYVSPATMSAISYCRRHKKKYYIEYDGGFNKKDRFPISILKKYLICGADAHFTTCDEHEKYLLSLGISGEKIYKYPFTSVCEADIKNADKLLELDKGELRERLGIKEEKVVLSVGQFIHRKGFDVLIEAASKLDKDTGIYIVGGEPTEEYIEMQKARGLENLHFVGFKTKDELGEYYAAANIFVLPTREDIWGLVVNEALSFGLPVVSTDRCIAALEMVKDGENGYIVPVGDSDALAEKITVALAQEEKKKPFFASSRETAQEYTIEKMATRHVEIFREIVGTCFEE